MNDSNLPPDTPPDDHGRPSSAHSGLPVGRPHGPFAALSALIDGIAEAERAIAAASASRAELLEQARRWSVANEILVVGELGDDPWGAQLTAARRSELAARSLAAEVGCALRMSETTVNRLLGESYTLVNELPLTFDALQSGRISYQHVQVMIDHTCSLPAQARAQFEATVLPVALAKTAAQFNHRARIERERSHPESIVSRTKTAIEGRHVRFEADRDGMAWLHHYLPATDALRIDATLTQRAQHLKADFPGISAECRTIAQLRSDILVDVVLVGGATNHTAGTDSSTATGTTSTGRITSTTPGTDSGTTSTGTGIGETIGQGMRNDIRASRAFHPEVIVTVPVMTLLGASEEPGSLDGYGPIDPETARQIAAHAPSFIRLLTHPETGATLSVSRQRYRVPADLRRALQLADETCRFAGCRRAARSCELDHTRDWADDGETEASNLAHLCPKHHHLKHETAWSVTNDSDRTLHWRSPAGREYTSEPTTLLRATG